MPTSRTEVADEAAVEAANSSFYAALESADFDAMAALWLHAEWIKCVHPGWEVLRGWGQVGESWEQIFANSRRMRAHPSDVEMKVEGDFALVSCTENLVIFFDSTHAPTSIRTTATNLFHRVGGRWLMVHHHASPVPTASLVAESELMQ
jgi:ketosteroid isomerase-like protein